MRKLVSILSPVFVILLLIGCSSSIAGTYLGERDASSSLRLESNGSFTAGPISGKYDVQGNELTLLPINTFAEVATFKIDGKKLTPVGKYLYFAQSYIKK